MQDAASLVLSSTFSHTDMQEALLRWAFAISEASTADIALESATAVSLDSVMSRVHLRLLFVSPAGEVLSMQANRQAAAAFVTAVHAAESTGAAKDDGPLSSMANALGRVRLVDDTSHEIFLSPDRRQIVDVTFESQPVRADPAPAFQDQYASSWPLRHALVDVEGGIRSDD